MKRLLVTTAIAIALIVAAAKARADDINPADTALQLGTVIGSEQTCDLTYDQDAIERFINEHVSASDMSFPSLLSMFTDGTKAEILGMSQSSLTAHCAQIRRIAKQYGFVVEKRK